MWCINDYLGMSQHPTVLQAAAQAIHDNGVGSGGLETLTVITTLFKNWKMKLPIFIAKTLH